jgi:hypothetical protein
MGSPRPKTRRCVALVPVSVDAETHPDLRLQLREIATIKLQEVAAGDDRVLADDSVVLVERVRMIAVTDDAGEMRLMDARFAPGQDAETAQVMYRYEADAVDPPDPEDVA